MTVTLSMVMLLTGSACGGQDQPALEPPPTPTETSGLPTEPIEDSAGEILIEGQFGGDAKLEGGCSWVTADGQRYQVEFPDGYQVQFSPLRLVEPGGEVLAREGDVIAVRGRPAEGMMTTCQVGRLFTATAVRTPAP